MQLKNKNEKINIFFNNLIYAIENIIIIKLYCTM